MEEVEFELCLKGKERKDCPGPGEVWSQKSPRPLVEVDGSLRGGERSGWKCG